MKRILVLLIGLILIGICCFYCKPTLLEIVITVLEALAVDLVFNYGLYLIYAFLAKKGKLKSLIIKTHNVVCYIPNILATIYCLIACVEMYAMLGHASFEIVAGPVIFALFSVDCALRIDKIIQKANDAI